MKALACASYDYMKLMVAELQRQLDAAEEENTQPTEIVEQSDLPKPPPRTRCNPFNKTPSVKVENIPRTRITFKELHTKYGRQILVDINKWKYAKKNSEKPLITF